MKEIKVVSLSLSLSLSYIKLNMTNKYPALVATKKEPEYQINPSLKISSVGTEIKNNNNQMPDGSALLTNTGNNSSLKNQGINYIIHAVPMPLGSNREVFIEVAVKAMQNTILLAEREGFNSLAACFLAGNIYCSDENAKSPLAEGVIGGALNQLDQCQKLQKIIFVDFDGNYYKDAYEKIKTSSDCPKNISKIEVKKGDLCQHSTHGASVIVNSENAQMSWGGGISAAINGALGTTEAANVDQQRKISNEKI